MSRIGKKPINVPSGVEVNIDQQTNTVKVKGPKGELSQQLDKDIKVSLEDGIITIERPTEQKRHKSMHGLYRSLIQNMVDGVSSGYTKVLEFVGVGYKAEVKGDVLQLNVGYSHDIWIQMPKEVKASAAMEKGKAPTVTLESHDKQLIGEVAAKLRSLRKTEPYKGKGVRFKGEQIRRKAGKAAAKK